MFYRKTSHQHLTRPPFAVISGASSGIGAAVSILLSQKGWRVAMLARNQSQLAQIQKKMIDGSGFVYAVDVSQGDLVKEVAQKIIQTHGVPQVVINAAGAGTWKFIEETSPDEAKQMMGAPYFAAFNLTHAFMRHFLESKSGLFIHINSPVSNLGWPGATGYMAARFALRGLHEALCLDLWGTGVRSSEIVFAKVRSGYFLNNPGSEEHLPGVAKLVPELTPEQCAQVIWKTIERPKKRVVYPLMLYLFYWLNYFFPWMVRALAVATGRKHL